MAKQRRPAVILGLVAAVFVPDVTFQSEVAAYLGAGGPAVSLSLPLLTLAKVRGLTWALELRLNRAGWALAALSGALLGVMPQVLFHRLLSGTLEATVVLWSLFGLGAAVNTLGPRLSSTRPLSDWGNTVLSRVNRAVWPLWVALVVVHALFWSVARGRPDLWLPPLFGVAALWWALGRARSEVGTWLGVAVALGVGHASGALLSPMAVMAAVTLVLVQRRGYVTVEQVPVAPATEGNPYRRLPRVEDEPRQIVRVAGPPRLLVGALFSLYLAVWTFGWSGGPWPAHLLWLDAALAVVLLGWVARRRLVSPLAPLAAVAGDLALAHGRSVLPSGPIQWGVTLLVGGFVLLIGGLVVNLRRMHRDIKSS